MTAKKPYFLQKIDKSEADHLNQNLDTLYRNKIESINYNVNGSASLKTFQFMESGKEFASASGSATITKAIKLNNAYNEVLAAIVTPMASATQVVTTITDITKSGLTVQIRSVGVATLPPDTTLFYLVIGSNP